MKPLTSEDLQAAGYPPGADLDAMLRQAAEYQQRGISDFKYLLKLLRRDFAPPPPRFVMRGSPAPLAEAILAESAEEKRNLAATRNQMQQLLRTPVITRGAILPDACPAGKAAAVIPVGGAIAVENAIIPSAHSADICCSMMATFYDAHSSVAAELDSLLASTRFGAGHRPLDDLVHDAVLDEDVWKNRFLNGLHDHARTQLADQGDGNHFAFLGEMDVTPGFLIQLRTAGYAGLADSLAAGPQILRVLVTHHGSRGLGAHVFKRGQIAAEKHVVRVAERIPEAAAWLEFDSDAGRDYWEALQYVSRWTRASHRAIHRRFLERIAAASIAEVGNEHNFVWKRGETFYHGKGATPAWKDEQGRPLLGLIPLNMAEPILLVLGSDNAEFLSFAPHGAGRNLSRTALKRQYPDPEKRRRSIEICTRGIDVRWYSGKPDVSETPLAYKNATTVKSQIAEFGLAQVIGEIRPLGCIMAGESDRRWRDEEELTPKQIRQIAHRADRRKAKQHRYDTEDSL